MGHIGQLRLCKGKAIGEEPTCKTFPKKTKENVHVEVEIMQHLSGHPNVVTLNAIREDANSLYLVMELCSGGCLIDDMSKNGVLLSASGCRTDQKINIGYQILPQSAPFGHRYLIHEIRVTKASTRSYFPAAWISSFVRFGVVDTASNQRDLSSTFSGSSLPCRSIDRQDMFLSL